MTKMEFGSEAKGNENKIKSLHILYPHPVPKHMKVCYVSLIFLINQKSQGIPECQATQSSLVGWLLLGTTAERSPEWALI